jgi:hypothetical protein
MNQPTHGTRILIVALVATLVLTLAVLAITFTIASTLPSSVAVHWNSAGVVDGHGSPYSFPILIAVFCLPLDAIFGAIAVLSSHRAPVTVMTKILAVVGLFITVLLAVILGGTLVVQQGHGSQAQLPIVWVPIGFGVAAIVSVGAWFVLPKAVKVPRGGGTVIAPVALGAQERASWIRSATAPAALTWGVVGFMVLITVILLFSVYEKGGANWPVVFIPVVIFLIVLSSFAWTIRVDARGVRMRSSLGIPTINVPLANIESAEVVDVQAISQYGGFGVRYGLNGRFGVILRSGEALEILRHNRRSVVVTVDDAASAAALINGLVQRAGAALP